MTPTSTWQPRASDVKQTAGAAADPGTTRYNLLGRDASGGLYQYQGTGSGSKPFFTKFKAGSGWQTYSAIAATTALRADGTGDLVARDSSGKLWLYAGKGTATGGPFAARSTIGTGWSTYNLLF
ncbi:hypothetical protein [Streptomyces sp. NBC_01477]|uniref:hypothetical protein n=1 Tax=Streptomyces sp. NBC_01477 TaxID=2976015 RepID=UPI002E314860|nr:hypothetical protein [Streptomyces sp. NBC_01477]